MVLSTTDVTAMIGVALGSVSLALVIYKTLKEKPKIKGEFVSGNWHKRTETSIATEFGIHVRIHNTGERNTTIHSATLETIPYLVGISVRTIRRDMTYLHKQMYEK